MIMESQKLPENRTSFGIGHSGVNMAFAKAFLRSCSIYVDISSILSIFLQVLQWRQVSLMDATQVGETATEDQILSHCQPFFR